MTRSASPNDFTVEVQGVGDFTFGRRTNRDRFKIAADYHRLTEGLEVGDSEFGLTAEAFATVKCLLVEGPADLSAMLDLDAAAAMGPDDDAKLLRVYFALRQKELSFRPGAGEGGKAPGAVNGGQPGVLVSPEVQPAAE
jgi:hypothetical protein